MIYKIISHMDSFTIDAPTDKVAIAFTTILGKELDVEKSGTIIKPAWGGNNWFQKEFGISQAEFLDTISNDELTLVALSFKISLQNYMSELYQKRVDDLLQAWRMQ